MQRPLTDLYLLFVVLVCISSFGVSQQDSQAIDIQLGDVQNFYPSIRDINWKLTFVNHTNRVVAFASCPTPYSIYVQDPRGRMVTFPRQRTDVRENVYCLSSVLTRIKPQETISTSFSLGEMDESDFSVPGRYTLSLCYGLPWVLDEKNNGRNYMLTVCSRPVYFTLGRCAQQDIYTHGAPVMFAPENGVAFGVSTEKQNTNAGEAIPVHIWLDNETDNTYNYVSECGWDFKNVFDVYDRRGSLLYDEIERKILLGAVPRLCGARIAVSPRSCAIVDGGMLDDVYSLNVGKYYLVKRPEPKLGRDRPEPAESSDGDCFKLKRALTITVRPNSTAGKH